MQNLYFIEIFMFSGEFLNYLYEKFPYANIRIHEQHLTKQPLISSYILLSCDIKYCDDLEKYFYKLGDTFHCLSYHLTDRNISSNDWYNITIEEN